MNITPEEQQEIDADLSLNDPESPHFKGLGSEEIDAIEF